uniref:protein-lysine 6-oxidase n=1 Tax=Glossina brevipalpis TaxID=37001 RepID=A0A1A9W825_9MUSC
MKVDVRIAENCGFFKGSAANYIQQPLNVEANYRNMRLRLNNSHVTQTEEKEVREGRVEVSFDNGLTWGTICATNWSFREANVICHQLNLGYAASTAQTLIYGDSKRYPWKMVGPVCQGTEASLIECSREERYPKFCNLNNNKVAVVRCDEKSPDLVLNIAHIRKSIHLVTKRLSALKCAMEEKCLSRDAYEIQTSPPEAERKLLRFTTTAENVGTADFFPYADYKSWQWHQCHNHYHSMEEFATFDIYDMHYKKQAEGHKASFCLEDTGCRRGVSRRHSCGNKTQGISVGCWDTYSAFIDCQWVDVTRLIPHAFYVLRIVINPGCRIGEISYENNVVECLLYYTGDQWTTFALSCVNASSKLQIDFWSKFKADLGIE